MTNQIEQEFYKAFDIKPKRKRDSETHLMYTVYPPITDRMLLELICAICSVNTFGLIYDPQNLTVEDIKVSILNLAIDTKKEIVYYKEDFCHAVRKIMDIKEKEK